MATIAQNVTKIIVKEYKYDMQGQRKQSVNKGERKTSAIFVLHSILLKESNKPD